MALIALGVGWYLFEQTLQWSGSDEPIESLADGADRIRELESAMGDGREVRGGEPPWAGGGRSPEPRGPSGRSAEPDEVSGEEEEEGADTGRAMDLEHLSEEDLTFLQEVLDGDDEEARLSAARALVVSGHARAVGMLFSAASRPSEKADLFCLAALDVARLQKKEDTLRELLMALDQQPPLSDDCRAEVSDRFALVGGRDPSTIVALYQDPEPRVRAWVVQVLSDEEGERVDEVLVALVSDPDVSVRARAWSAWEGRPLSEVRTQLQAAAAAETDGDVAAQARDVLRGG